MWSQTAPGGFVFVSLAFVAFGSSEVRSQCMPGAGGGMMGRRMMSTPMPRQMTTVPMMPRIVQQPPIIQLVAQQPPQRPGPNPAQPPVGLLQLTREQSNQVIEMIRVLQTAQKDQRLTRETQNRLLAVTSSAQAKSNRHQALLVGIGERQDKGLLTPTDQQRLVAIFGQQQALLKSLETYRRNAGEILARRDLVAVQKR